MGVGYSDSFAGKVVESVAHEERRCPVLGAVVTVTEAARALRCGRTRVFELLAAGRLVRGERFGRETVVTIASIEALQTAQAGHGPSPKRRRSKRGAGLAQAIRALPLTGSA